MENMHVWDGEHNECRIMLMKGCEITERKRRSSKNKNRKLNLFSSKSAENNKTIWNMGIYSRCQKIIEQNIYAMLMLNCVCIYTDEDAALTLTEIIADNVKIGINDGNECGWEGVWGALCLLLILIIY